MEPLPETLRRLTALIEEQQLDRAHLLDPERLAARTALAPETVRTLLQGGRAPAESVDERVCARIKALTDAQVAGAGDSEAERATTRKSRAQLVNELAQTLGVSKPWARQVSEGKKVPNVTLLHQLVKFFNVDVSTGESFFTAEAPDALNRELTSILTRYETPDSDPIKQLLEQFGVQAVDTRQHGDASITPEQLGAILAGVFQSLQTKGDQGR